MPTELRTCPSCARERPFEVPPCLDGHGADCPELACVDCGTALLVAPPTTLQWAHPPTLTSSHGAPISRAA
jgi:hypothetical protein